MTTILKLPKYLLVSAVLVILNILPYFSSGARVIFSVLYLIFFSLILGNWLFIKNSILCKFIFGLLFFLIIASLINTLAFYLWQINIAVHHLIIIIIPLLLIPVIEKYPLILEFNKSKIQLNAKIIILLISYLFLVFSIFYILCNFRTTEAIRTPWFIITNQIFLLYFLATLFLFIFLVISKNSFNLSLIVLHLFLTLSVVLVIYQIGFDYDPFIHRRNVELILTNGTLSPKPFYYLGQYGLIIFLRNFFLIPIEWLDKVLVPLLAALYIPSTIFYTFKDNFQIKATYLYLAILSLLLFPFTNFIVSTPQALSSLMFIISIIFTLYYFIYPKTSIFPLLLLTFFTLAIHPLSGIPLLFAVILILLYLKLQKKLTLPKILHQGVIWEIFILGCLALPLAFILNSQTLSQLKVGLSFNWLFNLTNQFFQNINVFYRPFITIYDLVYSYANNLILLFLALVIVSIYYLIKQKQLKRYFVYIVISIMIFINYYFLKTSLNFFSLVNYEQLNYPLRVLNLSLFSLLPFIIMALYLFFQKILQQKKIIILLVFLLISLGITLSFYYSYPRVDTIKENHGYSTSASDLKTVNFIETTQENKPYVVLASQPVSAAVIKELGYKYYYNDYFFYPVPTGGKLYQLYEDLIYGREKTADVIATVRYLTGVNDIYLVINSYWFDAQNRIKEEKDGADRWYAIDGKNFIFKYTN